QVVAKDGAGGKFTTTYTYHVPAHHAQGLGFIGFERIAADDSRAGVRHEQVVELSYARTGTVKEEYSNQPDGTPMRSRAITNQEQSLGSAPDVRHFVYQHQVVDNLHEIGGTKNGVLIAQEVSTFSPDPMAHLTGNMASVTATIT